MLRALPWFLAFLYLGPLLCLPVRPASAVLELSEKRSVQVFYRRQGLARRSSPRRGEASGSKTLAKRARLWHRLSLATYTLARLACVHKHQTHACQLSPARVLLRLALSLSIEPAALHRCGQATSLMRHAHSLLALQAAAAMAPLPWGKRPCQDYLKALREQTPARLDDGLVECHPLRHLRWTAGVSEEASSPLPPQLDFDARNSACHAAAAAGVDWTAVLRRARAYRGVPVPVVDVLDNWRVADTESLEVVIACACLDRRVAVRRGGGAGVALDFERAAPLLARAGLSAPEVVAIPFLDGARTLVRPERLASTRDLEAPVWPKVLHFAEVMAALPDAAARRERFGDVPVRRLANLSLIHI